MADNVVFQTTNLATVPNNTIVATDEVTYSGDMSKVQIVQLSSVIGVEGSKTIEKIEGTAANGLETDVTRIASGASADIGAVADAAVVTDTTGSISGKLRGLVKWAFERMPASLGQKAKTASFPVVIASDQDALAVTMAAVPTGAATEATLLTRLTESDFDTKAGSLTETAPATDTASSGLNGRLQRISQRLTSLIALLPASLGQKLMAASLPVVLASDQPAIPVSVTSTTITGTVTTKETRASTSALANVAYSTGNQTLLASNANRLGATIFNDADRDLYVKFGTTASATSFNIKMAAGSYFEVPFAYTGIIDALWSAGGSGAARVGELS